MSVYVTFDESPGEQLASNTGWADVGRWVESLPAESYPALCALWDHGHFEPASAVLADLHGAAAESPPDGATVRTTLTLLAAAIEGADGDSAVFVASGGPAGLSESVLWEDETPAAPLPPELLAAVLQAHARGDADAVAELVELADDPALLAAVMDGPPDDTVSEAVDRSHLVFDRVKKRWVNPNKEAPVRKTPAGRLTPKEQLVARKAAAEPARQAAREAWAGAVADPTKVTPDQLKGLADHLHALTRDELREVARGLRKKVGGLKREVVDRLLEHVGAQPTGGDGAKAEPVAARKPAKAAPKPAGGLPDVPASAIVAGEKARDDTYRYDDPGFKAAGESIAGDPAFRQTLMDVYQELVQFREYRDGLVEIPHMYHALSQQIPGLTVPQFHAALAAINRTFNVELRVLNEVRTARRPEWAMMRDGAMLYYLNIPKENRHADKLAPKG